MQRVLVPVDIAPAHPPINCPIRDFSGQSMGTTWAVRFVDTLGRVNHDWQAGVQAQLDLVVAQMSHWVAESTLGRYNSASAGSWHVLPAEFHAVMRCALDVAAVSRGAYDPTTGAIVNLWGFGPGGGFASGDFVPPTEAAIGAALADCGWQRICFDAQQRMFQPGGLQLDLSSIAKGYGVDLVARYLHANGIDHFLVEVGGELRGAGMKADGQPWWVSLEEPLDRLPSTLVALHGLSVATSGDYRRSFEYAGRRYAHTLDPRNGYPLSDGVASVTVLHKECMLADAWSTALGVMGVDEGLACAEEQGLAVRFLQAQDGQCHEHMSRAFAELLQ
jgi:thiamine biosynthesis lipoprotein